MVESLPEEKSDRQPKVDALQKFGLNFPLKVESLPEEKMPVP
jgi:hypothetical protein